MKEHKTAALIAWARGANQSGPAFAALQERILRGQTLDELQLTFLRRVRRAETKRQRWTERRAA